MLSRWIQGCRLIDAPRKAKMGCQRQKSASLKRCGVGLIEAARHTLATQRCSEKANTRVSARDNCDALPQHFDVPPAPHLCEAMAYSGISGGKNILKVSVWVLRSRIVHAHDRNQVDRYAKVGRVTAFIHDYVQDIMIVPRRRRKGHRRGPLRNDDRVQSCEAVQCLRLILTCLPFLAGITAFACQTHSAGLER